MDKIIKNIHFMGIGGSGLSGVAVMAKKMGYKVDGCNLDKDSPYLEKLFKEKIKVSIGHSEKHLDGVDLLVATPAIHYQNSNHPEYKRSVKENKYMEWSKFTGDYLMNNKNVIAVSGTHGKGTTSAMLALVFEKAGLDPSAIIGGTVKEWNSNFRIGGSDIFIIEADEFYGKFLDYHPQMIFINNIEFDHPDYFKDETEYINIFKKFVERLDKGSNLIINLDSIGVIKLFNKIKPDILKRINIYGYSLSPTASVKVKNFVSGSITSKNEKYTDFLVYSKELEIDASFKLSIPGEFNVSNAMGVIIAGRIFGISNEMIKEVLSKFDGIHRRMDKVFENKNFALYDDYAHHPTAIKKTLEAIRQRYPTRRIWLIDEPHSFSRTKSLLTLYEGSFNPADKVIIGPIFKARDIKTFGINGTSIVKISKHKDIKFIPAFPQIFHKLKNELLKGDVIVVMGAGESYKWTKEIVKLLKKIMDKKTLGLAKIIWEYHLMHHKIEKSDLIFVMGSNDENVAIFGSDLFLKGFSPKIIFSGNRGEYTKWKETEAEHFANIAIKMGISKGDILIENKSTNTGENILFVKKMLKGSKINKIILVQQPFMERRAYASFKKLWKGINLIVTSPKYSFDHYIKLFKVKYGNEKELIDYLVGYLQRIIVYPKMGFQINQQVPENVLIAYKELIKMGYIGKMIKS